MWYEIAKMQRLVPMLKMEEPKIAQGEFPVGMCV